MSGRAYAEIVEHARATLPAPVFRYFTAGAREEVTLRESEHQWSRLRLLPRVLSDVREPALEAVLLGTRYASPVGIAPTSLQRLAHPDGEVAMARAAVATDSLLVVSSNAGSTFEEIAETGVSWWLQAYLTADRSLIADTLRRAADCGARAIALTVDTPMPGTKYDIAPDDDFGDLTRAYGANHPAAVRGQTPGAQHAQDLGPADLDWLQELTGLPLVLKGILHPEDAHRAAAAGVAGVWVSNHGGRQLDRASSTSSALPAVVDAVAGRAEVYVDGGVRSGLDVLTAVAHGADGVFGGRLPLLALAAGAEGVEEALRALRSELREALQLAGCRSLSETRSLPPQRPISRPAAL